MKFLPSIAAAVTVALAAAIAPKASALCYDVNALGTYLGSGVGNNDPGPSGSGINGQPFYYKAGESAGAGSGIVSTVLSADKLTATLTFNPNQTVSSPFYLVLKASNTWVYWDISSYDPAIYDCLQVVNDGLITNQRGNSQEISHISLYGSSTTYTPDPGPSVPDSGATLALLGSALIGVGMIRRRLA